MSLTIKPLPPGGEREGEKMKYKIGDKIIVQMQHAMISKVLPDGRYEVILGMVKELPGNYITNVAVIAPTTEYKITEYK